MTRLLSAGGCTVRVNIISINADATATAMGTHPGPKSLRRSNPVNEVRTWPPMIFRGCEIGLHGPSGGRSFRGDTLHRVFDRCLRRNDGHSVFEKDGSDPIVSSNRLINVAYHQRTSDGGFSRQFSKPTKSFLPSRSMVAGSPKTGNGAGRSSAVSYMRLTIARSTDSNNRWKRRRLIPSIEPSVTRSFKVPQPPKPAHTPNR
jgi:hypothetical protein